MVRAGRRKSLRRVFLFEELLLFSKPRRGPTGIDTYAYKRSFKVGPLDPSYAPCPTLTPSGLTKTLSWPHRRQTWASLSAVGITTCGLRSGSAVARPGTPLCCRLPAWPPSRLGQLTFLVCSGGRPSTTRVGPCPYFIQRSPSWRAYVPQGPIQGLGTWKCLGAGRSNSSSQCRKGTSKSGSPTVTVPDCGHSVNLSMTPVPRIVGRRIWHQKGSVHRMASMLGMNVQEGLTQGGGRHRGLRARLMSREAPPMLTLHPEVRMAEMVSMGVGNKALQDIDPSEEAINDRTVNYILKCRGSRQATGECGCGMLHGR